ncbi:hypothetical protein BC829DRAFT_260161 [Chytridium lagenaria]|nr:hypothetical protein BC829DRAFT_260161 [Chytridium lagenaria]
MRGRQRGNICSVVDGEDVTTIEESDGKKQRRQRLTTYPIKISLTYSAIFTVTYRRIELDNNDSGNVGEKVIGDGVHARYNL